MDTTPSPTFDPTENLEKLPDLVSLTSNTAKEEDDQSEESPYSPTSPTFGPDENQPDSASLQEEEEDIKTPVSLTPKSPSSRDSLLVEEAMNRYYKLKGEYDKKYNNAKDKLTATSKGLSVDKIKKN